MRALLFSLLISLLPAPVSAGGGSSVGNGGHGVFCEDGSSMALDLYEGKYLRGFEYPAISGSLESAALEFARKIDRANGFDSARAGSIRARVSHVIEHLEVLPPGIGLADTQDAKTILRPKGCKIEQVLVFRRDGRIFADGDLWAKLPELSKAALLLHEGIYWYLRGEGADLDSRRARRAVAYVMTGEQLPFLNTPGSFRNSQLQVCHSQRELGKDGPATVAVAYLDRENNFVFQFLKLGGYRMIDRFSLTQAGVGTSFFPIDPAIAEITVLSGHFRSKVDTESRLKVSWGGGKMTVEGFLDQDIFIQDEMICGGLAAGPGPRR